MCRILLSQFGDKGQICFSITRFTWVEFFSLTQFWSQLCYAKMKIGSHRATQEFEEKVPFYSHEGERRGAQERTKLVHCQAWRVVCASFGREVASADPREGSTRHLMAWRWRSRAAISVSWHFLRCVRPRDKIATVIDSPISPERGHSWRHPSLFPSICWLWITS